MQELTQEEMLKILCAPESIDEPKSLDFEDGDDTEEEIFVKNWIEKEMS